MRLDLGRMACVRDHGYVEELDRIDLGAGELRIDAGAVRAVSPLAPVRLAMVVDAAKARGCEIDLSMPADPAAREVFKAYSILRPSKAEDARIGPPGSEVIVGCTRLEQLTEVDLLANVLVGPLVDHFSDVAVVQDAVLMAFSELCQNAIEHGSNPAGCLVAMSRGERDGVGRVSLGIGDLGIGIPDHIRGTQPRYVVDHHAIGRALEEGVSGTRGQDHRGFGFHWVLRESLISAATGAEMFIRAGRGTFRRRMVDGRHDDHGWDSALVHGTWIACDWSTVLGT
jgi:hypothetical protein